jgi:hypothetical protein
VAIADAAYVLCDHGYLRLGWCDECRVRGTQAGVPDWSVLLHIAMPLVFGLSLMYLAAPAILVNLATLLSLAVVLMLGWIVVGREGWASAIGRDANRPASPASRSRWPRS